MSSTDFTIDGGAFGHYKVESASLGITNLERG